MKTLDYYTGEITHLLREAANSIDDGSPERAVWRVADAGGLLREMYEFIGEDERASIGLTRTTGRGYVLPQLRNPLTAIEDVAA